MEWGVEVKKAEKKSVKQGIVYI